MSKLNLAMLLLVTSFDAFAATGLTYHGRIIKPNGQALEASNVFFRIQLRSPGSENCLLFDEQQNLNMIGSNGLFVLTIGEGLRAAPAVDGGHPVNKIFANRGTLTGLTCNVGTTYSPAAADGRKLQVQFNDGNGWEALAPQVINYVPLAVESTQVGGYPKEQLLRVADGVAAIEFSSANWSALWDLITGASSVYSKADGSNFAPTGSVDFNNNRAIDLADPISAQDAATKNYADTKIGSKNIDVSGVTASAGNGNVLTWDQVQNRWTTAPVNDSSKLPLSGGTMTGALDMGAQSVTNVGHLIVAGQGTVYLGKFDAAQEAALLTTPLNSTSDVGRTWFNTATQRMRYWDGAAAHDIASKTYVDSTVAAAVSASDTKLITKSLPATPGAPQNGQSLRYNSVTDAWEFFNPSSGTVTSVGDGTGISITGTASSPVVNITNTSVVAGSYGSASSVPSFTVNAQGQLTAAAATAIAISPDQVVSSVGKYFKYQPNGSACANNEILKWDSAASNWICGIDNSTDNTKVAKAGDTMTGLLTLSADPSANLGAATKQYVDSAVSSGGGAFFRHDGTINMTGNFRTGGNWISNDGGNEGISVDSIGRVGVNTSSPTMSLDIRGGVHFQEQVTTPTDPQTFSIYKLNTAVANGDQLSEITIYGRDTGGSKQTYANILTTGTTVTAGAEVAQMEFQTVNAGTVATRMTLKGTNLGIGTTSPNRLLEVAGPIRITASALPASPAAGDIAIDSGDGNKLKWYNGSGWQSAAKVESNGLIQVPDTSAVKIIYVNGTTGNDSNDGFAAPVLTLQRAFDIVNTHLGQHFEIQLTGVVNFSSNRRLVNKTVGMGRLDSAATNWNATLELENSMLNFDYFASYDPGERAGFEGNIYLGASPAFRSTAGYNVVTAGGFYNTYFVVGANNQVFVQRDSGANGSTGGGEFHLHFNFRGGFLNPNNYTGFTFDNSVSFNDINRSLSYLHASAIPSFLALSKFAIWVGPEGKIAYYGDITSFNGKVGIGTTSPAAKLDVQGQIRAKSYSQSGGAIDFDNGNSVTTNFNCASNISLSNLLDGGSYAVVVTSGGTSQCNFDTNVGGSEPATVTYRFLPANGPRSASSHSIYSLRRVGNVVYVSWETGY